MFQLSEQRLRPQELGRALAAGRAGALVTFEGWVRDHNDGRPVEALEYEAFEAMARSVGEAILAAARARFAILDAHAAHRLGPVPVGEAAVWVGVTAEHRQEAFLAARWIMDEIKRLVPVWKRETYGDTGRAEWLHAESGAPATAGDPAADPRYLHQVRVPGVGADGQRRLAAARVLVIGAGGLGCPVLQYLAAAGVGTLVVADGDRVDVGNLHRQVLFGAADVGRNKAEAAAERLRALNPHIALAAHADAATPATLPGWLVGTDLVLDCADDFEVTYLVHDACWQAGIPLVQAAVHQVDGWVQVVDPAGEAGCFRCQWPEPPPPGCVETCARAGVLNVTAGLIGLHQATQALAVLLGWPDAVRDGTLYVDVVGGGTRRVRREPRPDCPCRGHVPWPERQDLVLRPGLTAATLLARACIVDIRQPEERAGDPEWIRQLPLVPRERWLEIPRLFTQRPLVLCCAHGVRTRACVELLGRPDGVYAWTGRIHDLPETVPVRKS